MYKPSIYKTALPLLLILSQLIACGGGARSDGSESLASLLVTPNVVQMSGIGQTETLVADGLDANGAVLQNQPAVEWDSSNLAVALVSAAGVVTAVAVGQTVVTASYDGVKAMVKVTVDTTLAVIELNPDSALITTLGDTVTLTATAKNADGVILATQPSLQWSSSDESIVTVDVTGVITALADGPATVTVGADDITATASIFVAEGGVMVSGRVRYEDKEYGPSGFTGRQNYFKAVRFATVDLLDSTGAVVTTVATDAQGDYNFLLPEDNMIVRVIARTDSSSGMDISVKDINGDLYAVTQAVSLTAAQIVLDFDIGISTQVAGAFNMLDVFTSGAELIATQSTIGLPALSGYWRAASNSYGTYYCWPGLNSPYCPQGGGIYILGGDGGSFSDTDEYDDDVLWHEYGHYLEGALGINDSPGGYHTLTEKDQDLRLSWSEGWGDFFHAAVKAWLRNNFSPVISIPSQVEPSRYVDTVGGFAGISIDIADPYSGCCIYSSSEIAVAKVLWDLTENYDIGTLLDVIEDYLPGVNNLPATMETFWDGWLNRNNPGTPDLLILEGIFAERSIFYQEDGFEADVSFDPARKITVCTSSCNGEDHYLYRRDGVADTDLVAFDAVGGTTYTIETFGLKNAADTYLRILDAGSNLFGENDDRPDTTCFSAPSSCRNDALSFASLIDFTAAATGTYYIEITTSPDVWPMSGRYGSYSLRVTQP